jgi:hypothetical protein
LPVFDIGTSDDKEGLQCQDDVDNNRPIEMGSSSLKVPASLVNLTNQRLEVTSCHTGLIGDHHGLPSMLIQQSNRLTHSRKKEKSFNMIDVPYLLVKGSIPIEKNGPIPHTFVQ